ncbi:hypothetical protein AZE42_09863, partial [Rhizopogon vesiculosus]
TIGESSELQQSQRQHVTSHPDPHAVEVAPVRDEQALYVAPRQEPQEHLDIHITISRSFRSTARIMNACCDQLLSVKLQDNRNHLKSPALNFKRLRRRVRAFSGWFILLTMTFIVHDAELVITKFSHPDFWDRYRSIACGLHILGVHLDINISKVDLYDPQYSGSSYSMAC